MSEPPTERPRPGPTPTPGERRLAHPPSDRYRVAEPEPPGPERVVSVWRGVLLAAAAAVGGAIAITVLGGVLAISAGLLVAAAASGWAVGVGVRVGAGATLIANRRSRAALLLALGSVVLGQVGVWTFARMQGGVLGPIDYLGETFGLLVPLQLLGAAITAWFAAR